jgi:protein-S-isoprenylcysteine O-methyltransferase Ste14
MSIVDLLHSITTRSKRRRALITPIVLAFALGLILLVVFGSLYTDKAFGLPLLLVDGLGMVIGIPLVAAGFGLWFWGFIWFRRAKGTPVPSNPPPRLVTVGPYAWTRNPMLTGISSLLIGLGFLLHSFSLVFIWTPAFIIINVIELKLVEEPELARRFGESYREYKRRVPMLFPRFTRHKKG